MSYTIFFRKSAEKQLEKLSKPHYKRVKNKILNLSSEPYPRGCTKLKGSKKDFRIRIGDYRVIYRVEPHQLIIIVIKIGHRSEIYER